MGEPAGVEQPARLSLLRGDAGLAGQGKGMIEPGEQAGRHRGEYCATAHRIVPLVAGSSGHLSRMRGDNVQERAEHVGANPRAQDDWLRSIAILGGGVEASSRWL
jgi:hypothetical protein